MYFVFKVVYWILSQYVLYRNVIYIQYIFLDCIKWPHAKEEWIERWKNEWTTLTFSSNSDSSLWFYMDVELRGIHIIQCIVPLNNPVKEAGRCLYSCPADSTQKGNVTWPRSELGLKERTPVYFSITTKLFPSSNCQTTTAIKTF